MNRIVPLAFALLAVPIVAQAQDLKLVAVLPLDGAQTTLPRAALISLEESVRTKAGDLLQPLGYNVMTNETTIQILVDNGVDPEKACEASCALEAGREMRARYLIAGQVTTVGGRHSVFIRFFDVIDGNMLSSIRLVGMDGRELEDALDAQADELFAKARISGDSAAPGTLVVSANVPDAIVSIDGRPQSQPVGPSRSASFDLKPGVHQLKVSKHGYFEHIEEVDIRSRSRTTITAELREEKAAVAAATFTGGVTTMLTVNTEPQGALVKLDGKPIGRGPVSIRVAPGEHDVEAAIDLHKPAKQKVSLHEGDVRTISVALLPSFGRLEVTSTPAGALVYLDDRQLGTTPLTLPRVTSGSYDLRLTLADHYDHKQPVIVHDGETVRVRAAKLRPSVGSLRVTSEPSGARVIIDAVERGKTPLTVDKLAGGVHELRLELADYKPWVETVVVAEGEERGVARDLSPAFALLSLTSAPVNARVYVNGNSIGTTPLTDARVAEGALTVKVEAEGESYRAWEQRLTAIAGTPIRLAAELQPIFGRLLVVTTPPGAEVSLDGRTIGNSPALAPEVLAGPHALEVKLLDHRTERRSIQVRGERENVVEFALTELLPADKAALRMAQWEKEAAGPKALAWTATAATVALGGLAGWQYLAGKAHGSTKTELYAAYQLEREDAAGAWNAYQAAHDAEGAGLTNALLFGIGAGVATVGTVWLWTRVPARPTFAIAGGGGEVGVQGEW